MKGKDFTEVVCERKSAPCTIKLADSRVNHNCILLLEVGKKGQLRLNLGILCRFYDETDIALLSLYVHGIEQVTCCDGEVFLSEHFHFTIRVGM